MISVEFEKRTITGKKNKQLRRQGIVPGGISLHNGETVMIQATEKVVLPLTRVTATDLVEIVVDGKKYTCVVTEVLINPLDNQVEYVSLTELTPESHVTVSVPVLVTGVAPAVKNNLGVLVRNLSDLKLTVNNENIVSSLSVDISELTDVGMRILVGQIAGIEKHKLASEKDRTLAVVTVRPLGGKAAKGETTEEEAATEGAAPAGETPAAATEAATPAEK